MNPNLKTLSVLFAAVAAAAGSGVAVPCEASCPVIQPVEHAPPPAQPQRLPHASQIAMAISPVIQPVEHAPPPAQPQRLPHASQIAMAISPVIQPVEHAPPPAQPLAAHRDLA